MFHRLLATCIVVFWLVMTGLLLQRHYFPEYSALSHVPPQHVGHIFFQQEQTSDLIAYQDKKNVGFARVTPRIDEENRTKAVDLTGSIKVKSEVAGEHLVSYSAQVDMTADLQLKKFQIELLLDRTQQINLLIDKIAKVETFSFGVVGSPEKLTYPLSQQGFSQLMQQTGNDPAMFAQMQGVGNAVTGPEFTAQESSVRLNNETINTYLLTMKIGGHVILELHMSQIGQVLQAAMPAIHYKFLPYNIPYQ